MNRLNDRSACRNRKRLKSPDRQGLIERQRPCVVGENMRSGRQLILLSSNENMHARDDPFKLLHSVFTVSFGETATEVMYSTARAAAMTRKVGPNEGGTVSGMWSAAGGSDCKDSVR